MNPNIKPINPIKSLQRLINSNFLITKLTKKSLKFKKILKDTTKCKSLKEPTIPPRRSSKMKLN